LLPGVAIDNFDLHAAPGGCSKFLGSDAVREELAGDDQPVFGRVDEVERFVEYDGFPARAGINEQLGAAIDLHAAVDACQDGLGMFTVYDLLEQCMQLVSVDRRLPVRHHIHAFAPVQVAAADIDIVVDNGRLDVRPAGDRQAEAVRRDVDDIRVAARVGVNFFQDAELVLVIQRHIFRHLITCP
jgi:hypothetical protein